MADYKILIADDDAAMAKVLTIRLRAAGYEVQNANDGRTAIMICKLDRPDLIILDADMPSGNGLSVQQALKKVSSTCDVPVIFLTGHRSEQFRKMALDAGAYDVLYKPYDTQDLLNTLRSILQVAG